MGRGVMRIVLVELLCCQSVISWMFGTVHVVRCLLLVFCVVENSFCLTYNNALSSRTYDTYCNTRIGLLSNGGDTRWRNL